MDLRKTLYSNIVLSGGSTLFPGFGDRLLHEVKRLAPKEVKIKISRTREESGREQSARQADGKLTLNTFLPHQKGNTLRGSEGPFSPPSTPSARCGYPMTNMMRMDPT
jgi:hypothetical protein